MRKEGEMWLEGGKGDGRYQAEEEGKVKVSQAKQLIDVRQWICHFDVSHGGL